MKAVRVVCGLAWLALACENQPSVSTGAVSTDGTGGSRAEGGAGGSGSEGGAGNAAATMNGTGGKPTTGGSAGAPQDALAFVGTPTFSGNDNTAAPQVGIVRLETNRETSGSIDVAGGGETWALPLETTSRTHEKAVLGLKPDTEYEVTIRVSDGEDDLVAGPLGWRTPELPSDFPILGLVLAEPSQMEAGMTLFDVRTHRYFIVVDGDGQVRWYYRSRRLPHGHSLLGNGHLIFISGGLEIVEIDWLGNQRGAWNAADSLVDFTPLRDSLPVEARFFHHTVEELPNGNILTLSHETRTIENYPTSTTDPEAPTQTAEVLGDILVEFTRDGELANEIALLDVLDPTRVGHGPNREGQQPWSHCNAAIYDAATDAYVVSCRHQDAVIKIERDTQAIVWILGDPSNWREPWSQALLAPIGENLQWPYHQHAVQLVPGGIGLFDNGNYRAPAFATPQSPTYSRAVRFAIDEEAMTVEQTWSHWPTSEGLQLFSGSGSDADLLPMTGNTLIISGALLSDGDPSYHWVQVLEVREDGTPVFEMNVRGGPDDAPAHAESFEADRIVDIRFLEQ